MVCEAVRFHQLLFYTKVFFSNIYINHYFLKMSLKLFLRRNKLQVFVFGKHNWCTKLICIYTKESCTNKLLLIIFIDIKIIIKKLPKISYKVIFYGLMVKITLFFSFTDAPHPIFRNNPNSPYLL